MKPQKKRTPFDDKLLGLVNAIDEVLDAAIAARGDERLLDLMNLLAYHAGYIGSFGHCGDCTSHIVSESANDGYELGREVARIVEEEDTKALKTRKPH